MSALTKINLSFPYDWSNQKISDKALILSVLEHAVYHDIVMIIMYYGPNSVMKIFDNASWDDASIEYKIVSRMLNNAIQGLDDK